MSKTKKIISLLITVALIMTMATVALVSTSAAAKVYFEDSMGWGNISAYCFGGSAGEALGTWPGTACTDEGNGIWSVEVNGEPEAIIFNGGGTQTSNIPFAGDAMIAKLTGDQTQGDYNLVWVAEFEAYGDAPVVEPTEPATGDEPTQAPTQAPVVGEGTTVYFSNNWAFTTQNVYYWGTAADPEWPGVAMTFVETNDAGEDIYTAVIPAGATGIIFNGEHDQQPGTIRQTVDITDFAANTGYYCVEEIDGKITVGTYEYAPVVVPTTTTAPEVVPTTTTAPEVVPTTTTAPEVVPTTTTAPEVVPTTTTAPEVVPTEKGVVVDGTTYDVTVGDTLTYTVNLTAAELFEDFQAVLSYDSTKLELVRKTDNEDLDEDEIACPNLEGLIFNADIDGVVKFNATKYKGMNFKEEKVLITLDFKVIDDAKSSIDLVIEEMTIKGAESSYFTGSQQVTFDGISVAQTLTGGTVGTTAVVPGTTAVVPGTTAVVPGTTAVVPGTTAVVPGTTAVVPGTTAVVPGTTATVPGPEVDPTNVVDTTAATGDNGTVETGAAAYIYIAIAIMAMAACAVVVLRKKANG